MILRPRIDRPLLRSLGVLACVVALAAGCSRGDSSDDDDATIVDPNAPPKRNVGPRYLLEDDVIARTIEALADLKVAFAKQIDDTPRDGRAYAIGPGISLIVTNGAAIVRAHGFERVEDFEQALRHVQLAHIVVVSGQLHGDGHRDFDGGSRRKSLRDHADALRRLRTDAERDQKMSAEARRTRVAEIDDELTELDRQIAELDDIASSFGPTPDHVPPENVERVRKHREALSAILQPIQR